MPKVVVHTFDGRSLVAARKWVLRPHSSWVKFDEARRMKPSHPASSKLEINSVSCLPMISADQHLRLAPPNLDGANRACLANVVEIPSFDRRGANGIFCRVSMSLLWIACVVQGYWIAGAM